MFSWKKKDTKQLLAALKKAQQNRDFETVAKSYLKVGKTYKKEGKQIKAIYYLGRFDNLVGGNDKLYSKFARKDEKAMEWIDELEGSLGTERLEPQLQKQVAEQAMELDYLQKMQWLLLTMARFCRLFREISVLREFEIFGKLDEIILLLEKGLYEELDEQEQWKIEYFEESLEEIFDSLCMNDCTKKIVISGKESFVPGDLESGEGTYLFHMSLCALKDFVWDGVEDEEIEMEFAACGILADYYYRTCEIKDDEDIRVYPEVQREIERIFSDFAFVQEHPDKEKLRERIETYRKLMIL